MKTLKKKTTDNAVVGVVTAILIVGLIVAVFSLVQTMYIPKIMEQRESDHMDKVSEQFTYLTSVIDGQAANPLNNMPVATSITLGSKELPYMLSMKAFGTLEILDAARSGRSINITTNTGSNTYHIGVITYSSMNGYFLDQSYTYEAGAMIVSQSEGNLMMIRPSFVVNYSLIEDEENLTISFDIVSISSIGHKTIGSGFGTYPIQTELLTILPYYNFTNVENIIINTPFSNAWRVFINSSLNKTGLKEGPAESGADYDINPDTEPYMKVEFFHPTAYVIIRKIDIGAQIGPGWIE